MEKYGGKRFKYMTYYLINKRYYTTGEGVETHEYYVMPYDFVGSVKSMGLWAVIKEFSGGRAYLTEGMAKYNAKYHSCF